MSEAVPAIMAQSWPWGSQIAVKKKFLKEVLVEENDILLKFLHPIDPSVYLHWPATDAKCWVPGK